MSSRKPSEALQEKGDMANTPLPEEDASACSKRTIAASSTAMASDAFSALIRSASSICSCSRLSSARRDCKRSFSALMTDHSSAETRILQFFRFARLHSLHRPERTCTRHTRPASRQLLQATGMISPNESIKEARARRREVLLEERTFGMLETSRAKFRRRGIVLRSGSS